MRIPPQIVDSQESRLWIHRKLMNKVQARSCLGQARSWDRPSGTSPLLGHALGTSPLLGQALEAAKAIMT